MKRLSPALHYPSHPRETDSPSVVWACGDLAVFSGMPVSELVYRPACCCTVRPTESFAAPGLLLPRGKSGPHDTYRPSSPPPSTRNGRSSRRGECSSSVASLVFFFPHPAPSQNPGPAQRLRFVQIQTKTPEAGAKNRGPYPVSLGEKIRESFGCAAPRETSQRNILRKNHWNVPDNSRGLIRFPLRTGAGPPLIPIWPCSSIAM